MLGVDEPIDGDILVVIPLEAGVSSSLNRGNEVVAASITNNKQFIKSMQPKTKLQDLHNPDI